MAKVTTTARLDGEYLILPNGENILVGSVEWGEYLNREDFKSFRVGDRYTARKERSGEKLYWYGYSCVNGKQVKRYLGSTDKLSLEVLMGVSFGENGEKQITHSRENRGNVGKAILPSGDNGDKVIIPNMDELGRIWSAITRLQKELENKQDKSLGESMP